MKKLKILLLATIFAIFSSYGLQSCSENKRCDANGCNHSAGEKCDDDCTKKCCEKKCDKETCDEDCKHEDEKVESDSID